MVGIIFQIFSVIIMVSQGLGILSITERSVLKSSHMIVDLCLFLTFFFGYLEILLLLLCAYTIRIVNLLD